MKCTLFCSTDQYFFIIRKSMFHVLLLTSSFVIVICVFRARQHLRSLAPVWNYLWWLWWPTISGDRWGPKFSWHLSYSWRKTPEKTSTRKTDPSGIEPRPAVWEATMLPLDHSSGAVVAVSIEHIKSDMKHISLYVQSRNCRNICLLQL